MADQKKVFQSDSKVVMPDGSFRRLDAFTEEERAAMMRKLNEHAWRVVQDWVRRDPSLFDVIVREFGKQGIRSRPTESPGDGSQSSA